MATLLLSFGALALAQVLDPGVTAAPGPRSTEVLLYPNDPSATGEPCKKIVCYDYINTCSYRFGGCYPACGANARPTYSGAICEGGRFRSSFSKSLVTTQTDPCGYKCDYSTDSCGNTFGPGCYTSCPGVAVPSYTVPSCEAVVTPVPTIYVIPVPAMNTVALMIPTDAIARRQDGFTAPLNTTSEFATTIGPATSLAYTPQPISAGGATIGAEFSTISPASDWTFASVSIGSTGSDIVGAIPTSSSEVPTSFEAFATITAESTTLGIADTAATASDSPSSSTAASESQVPSEVIGSATSMSMEGVASAGVSASGAPSPATTENGALVDLNVAASSVAPATHALDAQAYFRRWRNHWCQLGDYCTYCVRLPSIR